MATFRIHPAIGIARLGNSPEGFYIAPDAGGQLPILCDGSGTPLVDGKGKEVGVTDFKDAELRILRQAARFRVFVYDDKSPDGREVLIGDHGLALQMRHGQQAAITVHQVVAEIAEHHGEDDRNQDLTRSQHMLTFLQHMATYGV